jgi:toxin HigB-1
MIRSFGDKRTADLFHGRPTKDTRRLPSGVSRIALGKMDVLNAACRLHDLRSPPGNRLEALKGDLGGYHSVRVNDQWRLVFRWDDGDVADLRLVDYH